MPFETPAETDELYQSTAWCEAGARLGHLIELKGIGMLTGEVGAGKTTVCRHLTAGLHPGLYRVHYVSLSTGNVLDMYKAIGWELGIAVERSRASAHHAIKTEVSRLAQEAKQLPVLVIDEAHHLRSDVLEDLRLLTNFAMDSVVLVHHARKSGAARPGQALRGSSELHAWEDSNLYLRRRDVQRWLTDWLTACAEHGRSPPRDLQAWLPWTMSEDRARAYTKAT